MSLAGLPGNAARKRRANSEGVGVPAFGNEKNAAPRATLGTAIE